MSFFSLHVSFQLQCSSSPWHSTGWREINILPLSSQCAYWSLICPYFFIHSMSYSVRCQGERENPPNILVFPIKVFICDLKSAAFPSVKAQTSYNCTHTCILLLSVFLTPKRNTWKLKIDSMNFLAINKTLSDFWGSGSNKILSIHIERCTKYLNSGIH